MQCVPYLEHPCLRILLIMSICWWPPHGLPLVPKWTPPGIQNYILYSGDIWTCITLYEEKMPCVPYLGHPCLRIPLKMSICCWAPHGLHPGAKMAAPWCPKLHPIFSGHLDLYHPVWGKNAMRSLFGTPMWQNTAKRDCKKSGVTNMPIWPPEYDLPGFFIFSLFWWDMVVTPYHIDLSGQWMGNCTEINDFPWNNGFAYFDPNAYFSKVHSIAVGSTWEVGANLMQHMLNLLWLGYVTTVCFDWSSLSLWAGTISNTYF